MSLQFDTDNHARAFVVVKTRIGIPSKALYGEMSSSRSEFAAGRQ